MRQKNQVELNLGTGAEGEARSAAARESEARTARTCLERPAVVGPSMEAVVERENLKEALAQVKRNKGAAGGDTEGVGRCTVARHSDGARPLDPAGGDAGAASRLGPDVLRDELWLSAEALGASGGGAGAGVYCVRPRRGGGYRSGEVLRSCQPRHPDGAHCQAGG